MQTCACSSESLSHVVRTKISWNYVRRQFNFNRAGLHALHARIQNILSEGVVREDWNATKNGPPSAHQRNAFEMAFCWRVNGLTLNAGLVALWFLGDPDQYYLWFFRGGGGSGPPAPPPSVSANGMHLKEGTCLKRSVIIGRKVGLDYNSWYACLPLVRHVGRSSGKLW